MKGKTPLLAIMFVLLLPLAAAETITCPAKSPPGEVTCTLNGHGTGRLYLKSTDGMEPVNYVIWINGSNGNRYSTESTQQTFELPANLTFYPMNVLGEILDESLHSIPSWVLLNKEHTFTFELVRGNGTRETLKAKLYIVGKPNWKVVLNDMEGSSIASLILGFIIFTIFGLVQLLKRHRTRHPSSFRFALIIGAWVFLLSFTIYSLAPLTSGVLYYYLGSGPNLWGDIVIGWAIWALMISLESYLIMYLLIRVQLESAAYSQPLHRIKKQRLTACSGLAWLVFPLIPAFHVSSDVWILAAMVLAAIFMMFTHPILKRIKPEGVLFINLSVAGFLAVKCHPDVGMVASLVAFLPLICVIQKKCLRRFSTERERVIREVESRVEQIGRGATEE